MDLDWVSQGGGVGGMQGVDPVCIPVWGVGWGYGEWWCRCGWDGSEGFLEELWWCKGVGGGMEDWCGRMAVEVECIVLVVGFWGQWQVRCEQVGGFEV